MKILIDVDTNDYNREGDAEDSPDYTPEWSLWGLMLATFQQWDVAGQTGYWTIDGETYCGTKYECEINYQNELLFRVLVSRIKEYCGDRFLYMWVDDLRVEFRWDSTTDTYVFDMRPEWVKTLHRNTL